MKRIEKLRGKEKKLFVCAGCGCGISRAYGSMRHPFCSKCFYSRFGTYDAYMAWMDKKHGW